MSYVIHIYTYIYIYIYRACLVAIGVVQWLENASSSNIWRYTGFDMRVLLRHSSSVIMKPCVCKFLQQWRWPLTLNVDASNLASCVDTERERISWIKLVSLSLFYSKKKWFEHERARNSGRLAFPGGLAPLDPRCGFRQTWALPVMILTW